MRRTAGSAALRRDPMQTTTDASRESRLFGIALQGLLVLSFLTGGSAQISGRDDTVVQLLALPMLAWALWRIGRQPASSMRNRGLAVAALVALVPLLQLLPVPEWLWRLPEARQALAADLAAVGAATDLHWSLVPPATERAFLFLLPPLAAFVGTLATGAEQHRALLRTVMLLAMFSLLLAFVQLGVPPENPLNPFPQWAHRFNGIFANQNHQAISMVPAPGQEPNTVVAVLQKGYLIADRVLRPALVTVAANGGSGGTRPSRC